VDFTIRCYVVQILTVSLNVPQKKKRRTGTFRGRNRRMQYYVWLCFLNYGQINIPAEILRRNQITLSGRLSGLHVHVTLEHLREAAIFATSWLVTERVNDVFVSVVFTKSSPKSWRNRYGKRRGEFTIKIVITFWFINSSFTLTPNCEFVSFNVIKYINIVSNNLRKRCSFIFK
jgi:hypothetical protein